MTKGASVQRSQLAAPAAGELAARVAIACRVLHAQGLLNYSGHISARLPGQDALLIHPRDEHRGMVRGASMLTCDLDGSARAGTPQHALPLEVFIHTAIYRARPDVQCVVHTHSGLAAALTMTHRSPALLKGHACRWRAGIPVHPDPTHIKTARQGAELAATLDECHAALLRAHGGVIVAESVAAAVADCVHFEENARAQLTARLLGQIAPLDDDELTLLAASFDRGRHTRRLWRYYLDDALANGIVDQELLAELTSDA